MRSEMAQNRAKVVVFHQSKRTPMEQSPDSSAKSAKKVKTEEVDESDSPKRGPSKCAKCKNHGNPVEKKGHKGRCIYENCECPKCKLIDERREVLRLQVKNQRQSKRDSEQLVQSSGQTQPIVSGGVIKTNVSQPIRAPNVVVSNEPTPRPTITFQGILESFKVLIKYLTATRPLHENVYKFAILELCDNDPIMAFQHLMRTNARLDSMAKQSAATRMQPNSPNASFVPVNNPLIVTPVTSAPGTFYSPMAGRVTLLSQTNQSMPYLPNVTTFRPNATAINTLNYGFPSMAAQRSAFVHNVCDDESNAEQPLHVQTAESHLQHIE